MGLLAYGTAMRQEMGLVDDEPAHTRMRQESQAMHCTTQEDNAVLSQFGHCGAGVSLPRPHDFQAPGIP
ncbi:hypothetical protein PBY51_008485 [Eleginops maclovinus]|uniref:Uncharacterized protein n=1 Tax=Eleginops maclovinus TaxID=56733 RepID=A0AAN7WGB4_ELEMC|nr:hypothetical protein PBY51_008485 [Eleginops maclovinus]